MQSVPPIQEFYRCENVIISYIPNSVLTCRSFLRAERLEQYIPSMFVTWWEYHDGPSRHVGVHGLLSYWIDRNIRLHAMQESRCTHFGGNVLVCWNVSKSDAFQGYSNFAFLFLLIKQQIIESAVVWLCPYDLIGCLVFAIAILHFESVRCWAELGNRLAWCCENNVRDHRRKYAKRDQQEPLKKTFSCIHWTFPDSAGKQVRGCQVWSGRSEKGWELSRRSPHILIFCEWV